MHIEFPGHVGGSKGEDRVGEGSANLGADTAWYGRPSSDLQIRLLRAAPTTTGGSNCLQCAIHDVRLTRREMQTREKRESLAIRLCGVLSHPGRVCLPTPNGGRRSECRPDRRCMDQRSARTEGRPSWCVCLHQTPARLSTLSQSCAGYESAQLSYSGGPPLNFQIGNVALGQLSSHPPTLHFVSCSLFQLALHRFPRLLRSRPSRLY